MIEPCISPQLTADFTFNAVDQPEILKISKDGFYVRGEKIPQDAVEAKTVFDAFVTWLKATGNL